MPESDNKLPATAAVFMYPGAKTEKNKKDGWWSAEDFWQQTELAMCIFERVFGKAEDSRFRFVASIDWSGNHAAKPVDGLDATEMYVGPGRKQPHLRATFLPPCLHPISGTVIKRNLYCIPGCQKCLSEIQAAADTGRLSQVQTIGRKGLKQVLWERGALRHGMVQKDMVEALQQFEDFSPKLDGARAHVTELMSARGHVALFGVKYHAELAHIERKWMRLKQLIRPKLNGKLGKLRDLLGRTWGEYSVHDARRAARHCRETMRAYVVLGDAPSLQLLHEEQKKQKGHRKVVDAADGLLKMRADVAVTEAEAKKAKNLVVRRDFAKRREDREALNARELHAEMRRRLAHQRRKRAAAAAAAAAAVAAETAAAAETAVAAETAAAAAVAAAAEAAETAAEASRELDALDKEAQKGQLGASEVVVAADALRARYGL